MRSESMDEFGSADHTNIYPDTHRVDPSYNIPLDPDSRLVCGTLGTTSYDNFTEQISSLPGEPPEFLWMTPVDPYLENQLFSSQPLVQYPDTTIFNPTAPPHEAWFSSMSHWDNATSHRSSPSVHSYCMDQTTNSPEHTYWARLNAVIASPFLDDFGSESITRDCASEYGWNDGIAGHCIEQPSNLFVDDGRHVAASTVFTDHNVDFNPSPRIMPHSHYSSPRSTPESIPHRPISLPTHCSPVAPAANPWKCPYCNYVQGRRRMVDLKRHIATHTKPSDVPLWTCCGYPKEAARSKGVPDDVIRETSAIYGRVGGCWETFSRRDALQRHLRKQSGRCFGDAYADWHPGNSNKRDRQAKSRTHAEDSD